MVRLGEPSIKLFHGPQVLIQPVQRLAFDDGRGYEMTRRFHDMALVLVGRTEPVKEWF